MPGEKTTLPDGRTVEFMEVNIDAMDDVCDGCEFQYENCTAFMNTSVRAEAEDQTEGSGYL